MKKVIIDTNLWISFLLGHQVQFVRRVLTDMRFEVYNPCCANAENVVAGLGKQFSWLGNIFSWLGNIFS